MTAVSIKTGAQDTIIVHCRRFSYEVPNLDIGSCKSDDAHIYIDESTIEESKRAIELLKEGPFCFFVDRRNRLIFQARWFGDVLNGPFVSYHKNGHVRSTGVMEDGEFVQELQMFNRSGKLIKRKRYRCPSFLNTSRK